jgi:hypothetical protein
VPGDAGTLNEPGVCVLLLLMMLHGFVWCC